MDVEYWQRGLLPLQRWIYLFIRIKERGAGDIEALHSILDTGQTGILDLQINSFLIRLMHRVLNRAGRMRVIGSLARQIDNFLIRDVEIILKCGVALRVNLCQEDYRRMAGRGYHELGTERFLAGYLRDGDVVVDVGAGVGMLTAVAAKLVGRSGLVYAFEVDRDNLAELFQALKRNRIKNVRPQNIALGESAGRCRFIRPKDKWGAFMYNPAPGSKKAEIAMSAHFDINDSTFYESAVTTLDEFFGIHSLDRLDLVKIDVDGPELLILRGGIQTITKHRPALIVEVSVYNLRYGIVFKEVWDFLKQSGYDIYATMFLDDRVKYIKEPGDLPIDITKEDSQSVNLFCCLPDVHQRRWKDLWFVKGE